MEKIVFIIDIIVLVLSFISAILFYSPIDLGLTIPQSIGYFSISLCVCLISIIILIVLVMIYSIKRIRRKLSKYKKNDFIKNREGKKEDG